MNENREYDKSWKDEADTLRPFATNDRHHLLLDLMAKCATVTEVAEEMGIRTRNVYKMRARLREARDADKDALEFSPVPFADIPIHELWKHREKQYERKDAHEKAHKLLDVKVNIAGAIGIWHCGDPHVDDDGADVKLLREHCHLVRDTEGMFGANVGDTTNAWTGRLARLYAEQGTSEQQAWLMAEYFLHFCPDADISDLTSDERKKLLSNWLYLIGGNHDLWRGAGDPINWMTRLAATPYTPSQIRLNLIFPGGRECRINARHDFKGTSQWNPAHGSMKASQMGFHDHILVNGHKHKSGYGLIKDPARGTISHCIQVASYKIHDRFAREKGFPDQHISPSVVTIIDPDASEAGFVTVFHDVEQAVDFLNWKRKGL